MEAPLAKHINWLLAEAKIDFVSLGEIIDAANDASDADPDRDRVQRTLDLLDLLFDRGFVVVDLTHDGSRPWPQQGRAALREIEARYQAANSENLLAMSIWFRGPGA
jgi:hypothetical protein